MDKTTTNIPILNKLLFLPTPNCFKLLMEETTWMIGASRDIEPGEELTWSYTLYSIESKTYEKESGKT